MNNELLNFIKLKNDKHYASIYYLGQEGVLLNINGVTFCIDPYLTDYVDKNCCTDVIKWERLYQPTIKGCDLDFVDYFLFTHLHYDHCDPWTIKDILKANKTAKFIIGVNNVETLISYGVDKSRIIPASVKEKMTINNINVVSYPAMHDVFHERDGEYDELCFSIEFKSFKAFHGGDTLDYPELAKYMESSNVCFLPINGRDDFRTKNDVIGNLNPMEAFDLVKRSNSNLLIALHNDLYAINCCTEEELNAAISQYKDIRCKVLEHDSVLKVDLSK